MAEIALALARALERRRMRGEPGRAASHVLARGEGWSVADVVCTSGPADRVFEEQHTGYSIAVVLTGTFQYRSRAGHALMTPGSLMLGSPGQCFECGHEHAEGDRCVSFWYCPDYFERLAADAGLVNRHAFAIRVSRRCARSLQPSPPLPPTSWMPRTRPGTRSARNSPAAWSPSPTG